MIGGKDLLLLSQADIAIRHVLFVDIKQQEELKFDRNVAGPV